MLSRLEPGLTRCDRQVTINTQLVIFVTYEHIAGHCTRGVVTYITRPHQSYPHNCSSGRRHRQRPNTAGRLHRGTALPGTLQEEGAKLEEAEREREILRILT